MYQRFPPDESRCPYWLFFWRRGAVNQETQALATLQRLHEATRALQVKAAGLQYKVGECKNEARLAVQQHQDALRAKSALLLMKTYERQYARLLDFKRNLEMVTSRIEEVHTMAQVTASLSMANTHLQDVLAKVDLEHVETLLDALQDASLDVDEASAALAREWQVADYDDVDAQIRAWARAETEENEVEKKVKIKKAKTAIALYLCLACALFNQI